MEQYRDFAFVYDELMNEVDYNGWVKYIEDIIKNENAQVKNILELACGTGNLTIPLTKKNYDIAGIDISDEMLSVAREKAEKEGIELVLLQQDIAELDFDVPNLDCILCACDGFNYLTYDDELESVFEKSYELLKDDGVFIFDIRKQLLNYDDVMNNQREIIYGKRNEILDNDSIHETVLNGFKEYISDIVNSHLVESNKLKENDYSEILEAVNENLLRKYRINLSEINGKHPSEVIDLIYENALKDYEEKLEDIPEEVRDEFEKAISLRVIDNYWMEHISTMSHLRDGIGLRGYANTSPLQAYTMEGYQLFDEMIAKINRDISIYLLKSEIRQNIERKQVAKTAITNDSKDHAKVQKKSTKVGRNDPCPCGSGKKYKQCCGK